MTDPWTPPGPQGWVAPDPWAAPEAGGYGWGPPPPRPPRPPRGNAWLPVAVVLVVAVAAAVVAVAVRPRDDRPAAPHAVASAPPVSRTPSPRAPTPTPKPTRAPAPPRATAAPPQPVRTYSPPPAGIPVRGRVVDVNGRPVAGAAVLLQQDVGWFESLTTAFAAVFTLGLACFADICEVPYGEGRTGADGTYTVFLEKLPDDYDLTVRTSGGPVFAASVKFTGRAITLPDVVYWNPAPSVERAGHDVRMRFRSPPPRVGTWRDADAVVSDAGDNPLLRFHDVRSGDSFDGRLVEDYARRLAVSVGVQSSLGPATYSASVPLRGGPRAPSRGLACLEYDSKDRPVRHAPCALTDGDLGKRWQPKVPDFPCANGVPCDRKVVVDLGSVRYVSLVVGHGCKPFFDTVEVSADGTSWTEIVGRDSPEEPMYDGCHAEVGSAVRYVRFTGPAGGFFMGRREIAVFF